MNIPIEVIRNNIQSLIPELNPIEKKNYYLVTCPSCGKKEAFVYKNKDLIICNRLNKCGYVSSIYDYLKEEKKITDKEIVNLIMSNNDNENSLFIDEIKEKKIQIPKEVKFFKESKKSIYYNKAKNYLLKRGISENIINELGYIYEGEYANRIFIPFYENEELVYFTTRDITNKNYRWKDPEGFDKHNFVYNIDKMYNTDTVFIFEGLMDVLSLKNQVGTAMLTNTLGKNQALKILETYPDNIVFVPDLDEAGIKTLEKNIKLLLTLKNPKLFINIYIYYVDDINNPKIKDFNETKKDYIKLEECENYFKPNFIKKIWGHI